MDRSKNWPWHGYLGILLMAVFWYLIWHYDGLRAHWAFFPLWLGYILVVNAWTEQRQGHSLLSRNKGAWALQFVLSAPIWWIFEWLNYRAHYWYYTEVESFSWLSFHAFATWNFSTVLPAIFGTAELVGTGIKPQLWTMGPKVGGQRIFRIFFFLAGLLMLSVFLFWPQYGAAFLWMSLFFILDPFNYALGYPSLLAETSAGRWRTVLILWIASLICGFFWEMWNYYAVPKWVYQVPFVDFWYIFEMPLLGYLGYLPFALELFAMYHFVLGLAGKRTPLVI